MVVAVLFREAAYVCFLISLLQRVAAISVAEPHVVEGGGVGEIRTAGVTEPGEVAAARTQGVDGSRPSLGELAVDAKRSRRQALDQSLR